MKKFIVLFLLIASAASAFNLSPFTYEMRQRGTATNKAYISNDTLYITDLSAMLSLVLVANDKVRTDTVECITCGDTTRILGTVWADTARVSNRLYFAVADYNTFLDSALVDSLVQQLGRFAPGGAGTGDIEGVTAGSGLTGGGITGTVTVDVLPGWGLVIQNDSVKVNATDVMDSISGGADEDSTFNAYYSQRWLKHPNLTGQYIGATNDSGFVEYVDSTSGNAYTRQWTPIYYREVVPDSALPTWGRVNAAIGATGAGDITGIITNAPLQGSTSSGDANLSFDWTWLYGFIDTTAAEIPVATLSNTVLYSWLYEIIDSTAANIPRATLADTSYSVKNNGANDTQILQTGAGGINIQSVGSNVTISSDVSNGKLLLRTGGGQTAIDVDSGGLHLGTSDKLYINGQYFYNLAGNALSNGISAAHALDVVAGTSTGLAVDADSVYITTVPDANIATTLARDSEVTSAVNALVNSYFALSDFDNSDIDTSSSGQLQIKTGGVGSDDIAANAVGTSKIADDSLTEAKLKAVNTAVDEDILTYESTTGDFEWHTPTELGLLTANQTITLSGDVSGTGTTAITTTIGSAKIATAMVQTSAIDSTKIAPASILLSEMATNAVDSTKIVNSSVGNEDLQTGSVNSTKILDASVALGDMASNSVDSTKIVNVGVGNEDLATGSVNSAKILDASVALGDLATGSVDSTKIVDGGIGSGDIGTGRITTTHVLDNTLAAADIATGGVATAEILDNTIAAGDVDTTISLVIGNLRTRARNNGVIKSNNFQVTDAESTLKIGGAQGLIIGSEITYGTDITDDSLVEQYIPEPNAVVLVRGWSTADIAYNDSITIRGVVDSTEGNALRFNDSTLTSGNHRRHFQYELKVPDDCDSLRRVIIRCKSGSYTATTTEFFTVARLARRSFTWSLIDSAIGGSLLDKDSSAAASATDITLASNWAVTEFGSVYLLVSGRRDAGTVYNYADIFEVRAIWHRTGL